MQGNRLVDGSQIVESVFAARTNAQAKIDLREGANMNRHGL
jgi:hypothetical protein